MTFLEGVAGGGVSDFCLEFVFFFFFFFFFCFVFLSVHQSHT